MEAAEQDPPRWLFRCRGIERATAESATRRIAVHLAAAADGASVGTLPRAPAAERQYRWAGVVLG